MALTSLSQIKDGLSLKQSVLELQRSYAANKVITAVLKDNLPEGYDASDSANYLNADELFAALDARLDTLEGSTAASDLETALNTLKNKQIKDTVRLVLPVVTDNGTGTKTVTIPQDLSTQVPNIDTSVALRAYTTDNEVLFNENGQPLTVNMLTGAFNGTPSVVDVAASKAATGNALVYTEATGLTQVKVFPEGTWTLETLPTGALLDNDEMQLVAYKSALDTVVVELAKDQDLIDSIATLVGQTAVADQIAAANATLTSRIDTFENESGDIHDAVDARVQALEDAEVEEVADTVAITATTAVTSFNLTKVPTADKVQAVINHLVYVEGEDFTVDRTNQTATWTLTAANDGFDITSDLTDKVVFNYKALKPAAETWSINATITANGANSVDLKKLLNDDQRAQVTNASTGAASNGASKTINVYVVKDEGATASSPVALTWVADHSTGNAADVTALNTAGITGVSLGGYHLDGDAVLTCTVTKDTVFKIEKIASV